MTNMVAAPPESTSPAVAANQRSDAIIGAIVVAVVVFITFINIVSHDFVRWDDDVCIYKNPLFLNVNLANIAKAWNPSAGQMVYQPVDYLFMAPIAQAAKLDQPDPAVSEAGVPMDPRPFHELSLSMHIVNCVLVYALLLMLFPRRFVACGAGALLFGLHPLQVESVAWASSVDRIISGFFALLTLIAYLYAARAQNPTHRRSLYIAAVAMSVAACLAKPAAITVPIAALLIDRFLQNRPWREVLVWTLPWQAALLPLIPLIQRVSSMHKLDMAPFWTRPFVAGDALGWHFYKLILPIHLGIDYGRNPQYVMEHWWGYATWLIPAAIVAIAYLTRSVRWTVAAAGIWMVSLLPDIGLIPFPFQFFSTVADRYDYFALVGAAIALAAALPPSPNRAAIAAVSGVIVLLACASIVQAQAWRSTPYVMQNAMSANPSTIVGRVNMAEYFGEHGDTNRAMALLEETVRLAPKYGLAHAMLGRVYMHAGMNDPAESELRQDEALNPDRVSTHIFLGDLMNARRDPADAMVEYNTALQLNPSATDARMGLAIGLATEGRASEARAQAESILQSDPSNGRAQRLISMLAAQ